MDIKGSYFNAFHDLKDVGINSRLANAGLILAAVSYITVIASLVMAVINYCSTGSLYGRVTVVHNSLSKVQARTNRGSEDVLQRLTAQLAATETSVSNLRNTNSSQIAMIASLTEDVKKEKKKAEEANEKATQANKRADTLMTRAGKSHIKRDWQQTQINNGFLTGEDYRNDFQKAFLNYESFACDCINVLQDSGEEYPEQAFMELMSLIYTNSRAFISKISQDHQQRLGITIEPDKKKDPNTSETVPYLFWHQQMQPKILAIIEGITPKELSDIVGKKGENLHQAMLAAAAKRAIHDGEQNLRIPQVARSMLKMIAIAELSDPCCYVEPAPKTRIKYKENYMQEILSPGVRQHGRIQEGDEVEVVWPGLYFEKFSGNVKPVLPCLVRRLPKLAS